MQTEILNKIDLHFVKINSQKQKTIFNGYRLITKVIILKFKFKHNKLNKGFIYFEIGVNK